MFVKICGITSEEDALLAIALGADALGFVFAPGSPRMVTSEDAEDIVKRLPHDEVLTFGVFRDERPERVTDIVNRVGLKGAQLHGREPAAEVAYVRERVRLVIQGYAAGDPALETAAESPADIVLVDSPDIKDAMLRDGSIRAALESAASREMALVGIGTLDESAPLIRFGHISARDRRRLLAAGAIGDVCTRFFTPDGEPVHVLDDRLIAIEWDELKRIPLVVAMAAGVDKRDAILGALRAACMNVLITDAATARAVLKGAARG